MLKKILIKLFEDINYKASRHNAQTILLEKRNVYFINKKVIKINNKISVYLDFIYICSMTIAEIKFL